MNTTVHRPRRGRLRIRMPYNPYNRQWFRSLGWKPIWDKQAQCWLVSRAHFDEVLLNLALHTGRPVLVVVDGNSGDRCDIRCQKAKGRECVCSCAGAHHGEAFASSDWRLVGDTALVDAATVRQTYVYDPFRVGVPA